MRAPDAMRTYISRPNVPVDADLKAHFGGSIGGVNSCAGLDFYLEQLRKPASARVRFCNPQPFLSVYNYTSFGRMSKVPDTLMVRN